MLKGLVSLVTGGASGLGRATGTYLAKHGGSVVLCDLPESEGENIAITIGENVTFTPCDVTKEDDVINALKICKEKYGQLDIAVNCAGLARAFRISNPKTNNVIKREDYDIVMKSNLIGTFNVCRLASQLMSQNKPNNNEQRGVIINTGSFASEDGLEGQSLLAAAKGATAAMTLPMARDLAPLGIRVLTISPGLFATPLTSVACLTDDVRAFYTDQIPFPRRFGHPEEFAELVGHIIENPMLNGENIKINGALRFFYT